MCWSCHGLLMGWRLRARHLLHRSTRCSPCPSTWRALAPTVLLCRNGGDMHACGERRRGRHRLAASGRRARLFAAPSSLALGGSAAGHRAESRGCPGRHRWTHLPGPSWAPLASLAAAGRLVGGRMWQKAGRAASRGAGLRGSGGGVCIRHESRVPPGAAAMEARCLSARRVAQCNACRCASAARQRV